VPWDTLLQRLTTDVAGGNAPDLSIIGTRWLLDFAAQGIAEPVDGYLTPEFKDTFIDTFMSPSVHRRQDDGPSRSLHRPAR
jgi:multiple sugar transport system substrate-binding protein